MIVLPGRTVPGATHFTIAAPVPEAKPLPVRKSVKSAAKARAKPVEPVIPLRLFRGRTFSLSSGMSFMIGFALFGVISYLPLFLQLAGGASATSSGLTMLPLMGGLLVASLGSGQVISKSGRYRWFPVAGTAIATVGMYLLSTMSATTPKVVTMGYMVVLGVGIGLVIAMVNGMRGPRLMPLIRLAREFASGMAGNQFIGIGGALPPLLLPLLVTARLSAQDNAYFYTTWMMCAILLVVSPAIARSLFAEGVHSPAELRAKTRSALAILGALLVPSMVVFLLVGGVMLSSFGSEYQSHASGLLTLIVLSAVPDAITNVYVAGLQVQRRLVRAACLNMGIGIATLALSWVLLPVLGITAVGWAWLGAQAAGCVVVAIDFARGGTNPTPQPAPVAAYPVAPPAVVYAAPAPRVVFATPFYAPAPVVTFGFGFGRSGEDGGAAGADVAHWCTILVSVTVRLLMHPRCRQATAPLARRVEVQHEFCGAWRLPGACRPSTGLSAIERRTVSGLAVTSRHRN